jgi:hypothetical protein
MLQSPEQTHAMPPFMQVQHTFTQYIRQPDTAPLPDGIEARRMKVYADLFFNNVRNLLASTFPVLHEILGDDAWETLIRDYFTRHRAHTPLFPQMPAEFLHYLQDERTPQPEDLPFLTELAHYEWVELALGIDTREIPPAGEMPSDEAWLQSCPVLSPLAWLLAYRFPVHRLSPDYQPAEPSLQPVYLLVYRNRDDAVGFLELNPVSARLLELISQGEKHTAATLLDTIAKELNHPDPEMVRQGGLEMMRDLFARDVLVLS